MKLKFLITVPDKYTRETYYAGTIYEFEDKRAKEILSARTPVTKEPYAEEYVEPVAIAENVKETFVGEAENIEPLVEPTEELKEAVKEKTKKKKKTK